MNSVIQMCTVSKEVPLYTGKTFANYVGLCVIGFRIHYLLGEGQQNADAIFTCKFMEVVFYARDLISARQTNKFLDMMTEKVGHLTYGSPCRTLGY